MSRSTQALKDAARRRSQQAESAVTGALREARKTNAAITFSGIAASAGVSTDFIYRHPELRAQVEALRRTRGRSPQHEPATADIGAADSTLVHRLTNQLAEVRRKHREETAELRRSLAAAHGELLELRRTRAAD